MQYATTLLYLPVAVLITLLVESNPLSQFAGRLYLSYVFSFAGIPIHLLLGALTGGCLYGAANPSLNVRFARNWGPLCSAGILVTLSLMNLYTLHRRTEKLSIPPADPISQAYASARARDWKKTLDNAKQAIQASPERVEPYHVAGLAAGQIYGLHSAESRSFYAEYVKREPDPAKKAFVKEIFPELIK